MADRDWGGLRAYQPSDLPWPREGSDPSWGSYVLLAVMLLGVLLSLVGLLLSL